MFFRQIFQILLELSVTQYQENQGYMQLNGCQFIIPKHQNRTENIKALFVVHNSTVVLPLDALSFRNWQDSCINHWWFKPKRVLFGCKLWYLYPLLLPYRFTISLNTQRFNDMYIALKSPVFISLNSLLTTQKLLRHAALCQFAINQEENQLPCQMARRLRPSRPVRSFFAASTAEGQEQVVHAPLQASGFYMQII